MRKHIKTVLLALLLALLPAMTTAAIADPPPKPTVVRVAFPQQDGLTETDAAGNRSGYVYEYLQEIAQYTGWEYEFIEVPGEINESLTTLLGMVERGEADLIGGMLYSDELAQTYDYAGYSLGTVYTTLSVPAESSYMWAFETGVQQVMRVAVTQEKGQRIDELNAYCEMNQITPLLLHCRDRDEQMTAMREGRADVMLNVSLSPVEGARDIAQFAPRPFYCAVTKGRADLLAELNRAIFTISQTDPYYTTRLHETYFARRASRFVLTSEERRYLAQAKPLRVGMLRDDPPFQYADAAGVMRGITPALLDHITQETGLRFELVWADDAATRNALLADRSVDLLAGMTYDYDNALRLGVSMTRPYTVAQYMLVLDEGTSAGALNSLRLALPETMVVPTGMNRVVKNARRYPTFEDCARAVQRGEADGILSDGYAAQFFVNRTEFQNFKLVPVSGLLHQAALGVAKPVDGVLLSILNKAILNIDADMMQSFVYQNMAYRDPPTLTDIMRRDPLRTVGVIGGVSLIIIGALAWGLTLRGRMNRHMILDMKKHMQLYALASEQFFEYDFEANRLILPMRDEDGSIQPSGIRQYDFNTMTDQSTRREAQEFMAFLIGTQQGTADRKIFANGETHWMRFTVKTIYDSGRPAYIIGKIQTVDEEYREKQELIYQAEHDSLSGLLNAQTSRQRISERMAALAPDEQGALLLMDLDEFKAVNDTFGHLEGDRVLRQCVVVLHAIFDESNLLGRPGGDEFVVYLPLLTDRAELERLCGALCERLHQVTLPDGRHMTCSIGAAPVDAGQTYSAAYQRVDELLYQAKRAGRDRFALGE